MNKFMKYPALVVLLLLVAVVTAACGGGGTSNTPEGAVKAWFDAAFANNVDGVKAQTCAADQDGVETAAAAFGAGAGAGTAIDASGLTYTKATESGDSATVTLGGSIKATVEGQEVEQPMPDLPIPLIKENGAWKVCNLG